MPQPAYAGAVHGGYPSGYGPPPSGYGPPAGHRLPVPSGDAWRRPSRVEPIPGTGFAVGYLAVPPTTSGLAVGSLVVGLGSILISFVVAFFGLVGARAGWGALVAGAFAVLACLTGIASIGLGLAGLRQVRRADPGARISGRGLAIAGLACGGTGVAITVLAFFAVLLIQVG